ncbi:hypothetical protein AAEO56_04550 [Flavobacterium sp. DGU11]|uniref:Uncharacterized protein n=1 Tax=Flavobacterium arundinis TaxID=3139143 RepID=A0ABU9HUA1_9FLAO
MENQKLTQRPQAATITENALIHVAEPFDISQGADGSSYKFPVANLFVAGQDNIDIKKYVFIEDDDNLNVIVSKINGLPLYEVNEKQSVWFIASGKRSTPGLYSPQRILKFKMMNKGKGKYGVGATQLTADDVELMYSNEETLSDIGADPVTDIVNYGALESEGQTVSQWLNSHTSEIVIQPQNEGYTIFQGTLDAVPASYLWIGAPGVYGVGEQQSTEADFQTMDDTIPQYENNAPLVRSVGLIETLPAARGMRIKLNQITTIITPIDTPVLFTGYTISETGISTSYTFLFMGGKGTWGYGGNTILQGMLYLLLEKPLSIADVGDNDTTLIIPLSEIEEGGFLAAANEEEHDFTETGLEYYFGYYIGGVLYLALFIGSPGVYGGGLGANDFINADFAQVTNGNVSGIPTLEAVTAVGRETGYPITVYGDGAKLQHQEDGHLFTGANGYTVKQRFNDVSGNTQFNHPEDKTGPHTYAMLDDVGECVPLSGTAEGKPITGNIEFTGARQFINGDQASVYSILQFNNNSLGMNSIDAEYSLYSGLYVSPTNISGNVYSSESSSSLALGATGISLTLNNTSESIAVSMGLTTTQLFLDFTDTNSKGISGSGDYTANIGLLDYTQKKYVDARTLQQILTNGTVSNIGTNLVLNTAMGTFQLKTNGDVFFGGVGTFQISHPNFLFGGPGTFSSDVQLTGFPNTANSAITKGYVDNAVAGLNWKVNCVVATTANITLSGLLTIDDVTVAIGDRVLVKNQTIAAQNGIYLANEIAWVRAGDSDTGEELANKTIPVTKGTVNQDTWWTITNDSITLGTTAITLSQTGGMGTYTNGTGIQLVGNIFSADPSYIATAVATALAGKQATLVSGTNIKTIEGQSLLGPGNIDFSKSDVGLGNVDNTSDANKPVSTAQQTAIDTKLTNGGDTTGATVNIGSNDAQQVVLKYNNSPVITIPSAAGISLPNGGSISNASASGRGTILMGTTGVGITLQRNLADAAAAATINNAHTSSTGNIIEFNSNISGATATRAFVSKTGQFQGTAFKLSALNTAPSSSADTGTTGEIRITATYIYVCVATNTWVRSALTNW